jgi:hypothetical protein
LQCNCKGLQFAAVSLHVGRFVAVSLHGAG